MNNFYNEFFHAMVPEAFRLGKKGPDVQFTDTGVPYIKDAIIFQLNVAGAGSGRMYHESAEAKVAVNKLVERSRDTGIPMQFGTPPERGEEESHEDFMIRLRTVPVSLVAGYIFNARVVSQYDDQLLTPGIAVVGDIVPSDISEHGRSFQEILRQGIFNWRLGARTIGRNDNGYSSGWATENLFSIHEVHAIDLLFDDLDTWPESMDDYTRRWNTWRFSDRCRSMANCIYGPDSFPAQPEPKRPDLTPISFKVSALNVSPIELLNLGFDSSLSAADINGVLEAEEKHLEWTIRKCDLPGWDTEGFDFATAVAWFVENPDAFPEKKLLIVHRPTRRDDGPQDEDTRRVEVRKDDSE